MATNKPVKCKICGKKYVSKQALIDHIDKVHYATIPEGWNAARYENFLRTGKTEGHCVYCKAETGWNDATGKYNRMCGSEKCKKIAREKANKNYIGLHGKPYSINDPEQQKKMVYGRKNSGKYIFEGEDGKKYTAMYDSSYGKDFFEMIDTFLNWDGADIIAPSPHTYWYEYEGKKHFYIPDTYSTSLNLEIELKDGGDNPNKHPKIQAVDKVKEQKKDAVMESLKGQVNYIKICNKDYTGFFAMLSELKQKDICPLPKWEGKLESITESFLSSELDWGTCFGWYHLEKEIKKTHGGWDEEQYFKDLDSAVRQELSSLSLHQKKGAVIRYVYTLGKEYSAVLLGSIIIKWYDYWDHIDPQYEFYWESKENVNLEDIDAIKNPVLESLKFKSFLKRGYELRQKDECPLPKWESKLESITEGFENIDDESVFEEVKVNKVVNIPAHMDKETYNTMSKEDRKRLLDGNDSRKQISIAGSSYDDVLVNSLAMNQNELERMINSENIVEAYNAYINATIDRLESLTKYSDIYSDLDSTILNDMRELRFNYGLTEKEVRDYVAREYFEPIDDPVLLRKTLTTRYKWNERLMQILQSMLTKNYEVLGYSRQEAIRMANDIKNGNKSLSIEKILEKISNDPKYIKGKSIDLRELGLGIIYFSGEMFDSEHEKYYKGFFSKNINKYDTGTFTKEAVSYAFSFDVVICAHGSYSSSAYEEDYDIIDDYDGGLGGNKSEQNGFIIIKKIRSINPKISSQEISERYNFYFNSGYKYDKEQLADIKQEINDLKNNPKGKYSLEICQQEMDDIVNEINSIKSEYIRKFNKPVSKTVDEDFSIFGSVDNAIIHKTGPTTWTMQKTAINGSYSVDNECQTVVGTIKKVIREHPEAKRICVLCCNPGGVQLPDYLYKDPKHYIQVSVATETSGANIKRGVDKSSKSNKNAIINRSKQYREYNRIHGLESVEYSYETDEFEFDSILEATEQSLMEFASENGVDYDDDVALLEAMDYIYNDAEIVQEGVIAKMWQATVAFIKNMIKAIVGMFKAVINFFKKIFQAIKNFIRSLLGLPTVKQEISYIALENASIDTFTPRSNKELDAKIRKSCETMGKKLQRISQEQTRVVNEIKKDAENQARKSVNESTDVSILETKTKPNNIERAMLITDPMLNYDDLMNYYRKKLFHEKLNKTKWQQLYNELINVREYLKRVVNSNSEKDKRLNYEANKALKQVESFIQYMEEKNATMESVEYVSEQSIHLSNKKWYHLVPKGTNVSDGIISPWYMKEHGMNGVLLKSLDKYRERLCNPEFNIYPNRDPESLTTDEILEGLNKIRGEYGSKCIYLFRFPPYYELGNNMKEILKCKDLYEVDLSKVRDLVYVDYGRMDSHGDGTPLDEDYYSFIKPEEYFARYDDSIPMVFSRLNHISVATKSGRIPKNAIKKISIPKSISDVEPMIESVCVLDGKTTSSDVVMENVPLETLLTTNPFEKEMTLYHGTYKKLDVINPTSFNGGTKLSRNRMSSFWALDYNEARTFAFFRLVESMGYMVLFTENFGFYVKPSEYDSIVNQLKNKSIYIYKKTVSKDYIGIGHSSYGEEFTIDLPVKPDEVFIEKYNDFKDIIDTIELFPSDDDNEIKLFYKSITPKIISKRVDIRRTLVTKSYDEYKKSKKASRKLLQSNIESTDIFETGEFDEYKDYADLDSAKGPITESSSGDTLRKPETLLDYSRIAKDIYKKSKRDEKEPIGNQNCQLCTWCYEARIRGINVLPRPVYSPRDVIFSYNGYDIVKNPMKIKIKSKTDVIDTVLKNKDNCRYYVHVNWKNSTSGHEFIVAKIDGKVYVLDGQAGLVSDINSPKGSIYFRNVNFNNSFMVRMDDKDFNNELLKLNDESYIVDWVDDDVRMLENTGFSDDFMNRYDEICESTFIEAEKDDTKYYPVFIFLSFTGTNSCKFIKAFTHDPYSHSSLSFDTDLKNMVSFNKEGIVDENIFDGIYKKNSAIVKYSLYAYMATIEEYEAMRDFVNELLGRRNKLRYNLLGLTNFVFGRGSEREDKFFCSEFVAAAISAGNKKVIKTQPYMTSPYMLAKNKNFIFIKKGILKNYDSKVVDKILEEKLEEGGFTNVVIK